MNASDRIPKQIEEVLVTHRRGFLRNAGLLAVSLRIRRNRDHGGRCAEQCRCSGTRPLSRS